MRKRWLAGSCQTLGILAVGSGVVGAALHVLNERDGRAIEASFWMLGAFGAISFGGTAAYLAHRRRALTVGWVMLGTGLGYGLALLFREYGVAAAARDLPFAAGTLWVGSWLWAPAAVLSGSALPLVLPDGRLLTPRWRPAVLLSLLAVVSTAVQRAFLPYELHDIPFRVDIQHPIGAVFAALPVVDFTVASLGACAVGVAIASVALRWKRSAGERRQQLKWVFLGAVVAVMLFVLALATPLPPGEFVAGLAVLPIPLACAIAAVRHRLWDVDMVLSRSLLGAALSAAVVLTYVIAVGVLGGFLGQEAGVPLLATVAVALVVVTLHHPVRRTVNRLVHGESEDPYTSLTRLGERLAATSDPDDVAERLLPDVVQRVARLLRSPYVGIELSGGDCVEHGERPDIVDRIPLNYGGAEVGGLVLSGRPGRSRGEWRRLDRLAVQAAVTVHSVVLIRDIRQSRQLVVAAREEERRRLRQDLHDGMGPALAALALQAETARVLLADNPAAAATLLDRLVPRLNSAVADVRTMAHELRSPLLDDLGLAGAVRELAARFDSPQRKIHVELGECAGLPAAVDIAAYRIVAEALTNATRHADPRIVTVKLRCDATWLHVAVEDDGPGIESTAHPGMGLASMCERAAELSGHCSIGHRRDNNRGTAVTARLPIAVPVTVS